MNQKSMPPKREPVSELVLSITEAAEPIPLTIPLDRPEPVSQLSPEPPELEPQLLGELARDEDWKNSCRDYV
jgi:hypothetical protein